MKKHILSLLLAMCLVIGLLPMVAFATDGETATLTFKTKATSTSTTITWTPELSAGMATIYAKTTEEGTTTTEGASATDWNIKIDWNLDGDPTLTLKDAKFVNNTLSYTHTITIGGSANFVILLEGDANSIVGSSASTSTTTRETQRGHGIRAVNTGTLTICGTNKRNDALVIDNKGGHCIVKKNNALIIKDVSLKLQLWNTATYSQSGIVMSYGDDKTATNLNVLRANLHISVSPSYHSMNLILMAGAESEKLYYYAADNAGDILFKDSNIRIYKSNSTSSTQVGSTMIRYGEESEFTIDNSEVYLYGRHSLFHRLPDAIENCTGEAYYTPESGKKTTVTADMYKKSLVSTDGKSVTKTTLFRVTHACQEGDTVTVTSTKDCHIQEQTITYCKICDKEMSKTETGLPTKKHTPGARLQYDHNNDAGGIQYTSGGSYTTNKAAPVSSGKYINQYVCSICGEIYTEEEFFQPAFLYYGKITKNEGKATEEDNYTTSNFNSTWNQNVSSGYTPNDTITPGKTLYFKTTENRAEKHPGYFNMVKSTASDWNIKFEYPLYGNPVMTLKDAKLVNCYGLWYSFAGYNNVAPLTIVLEGYNEITHPTYATNGGAVNLRTTNPVTITGSGSLNIIADCGGDIIRSMGDLSIIDTTINIVSRSTGNSINIISVGKDQNSATFTSADLVIKNSTINILSFGNANTGFGNAFAAYKNATTGEGGNITIENSNITIRGTADDNKAYINAANDLTITTSELHIAHGYATAEDGTFTYEDRASHLIKYGGTFTWNYAYGLTGKYNTTTPTKYDISTDPAATTFPESYTEFTDISEIATIIANSHYNLYVDIIPNNTIAKFEGTAVTVEDDLTLEFAIQADKIPEGSKAYITRGENTTQITLTDAYKEGAYYIIPCTGIAAKEMHDQITVVIKDADGKQITETKTDSVYDYVVRMLKGEKPEDMSDAKFAALKTILVDMLNYGTMAQVQFNHNTENLANKVLTPTEWTYASAEMTAATATPATTNGIKHLGTTFELNNSISMLIAVEGEATSAKVYVDGEYKETVNGTAGDGYTIFTFNGLNAADGRKEVKFEINGDANVTVTDSLAAYVGRNIETYPYLENLMKYCDAAAAYFTAE